ncbi:MAG: hypothetical protein MASP_01907 [Candidatus Methanolliviera sp. GoM_asphalt]|nr:MAG: hypothetical protein MASP_01907 [Candidatus Methanolliviera sp. GoM_asphalt]
MWRCIAGMQGVSGFPAGHYCNELERNTETGDLRIHITDQDWLDYVNNEGQVEYDLKEIDRYEPISEEEANALAWDWCD